MDFIQNITTKFLRHIGSIERLKNLNTEFEKRKNISENHLGEFMAYVLHLKTEKNEAIKKGDFQRIKTIEEEIDSIEAKVFFKLIDKKTDIIEENGEIYYKIESPLLGEVYEDYTNNTLDLWYDQTQFQNSLIISLVIGLEILIAEIFKDYVNSMDVTDQLLKDKHINFNDLKKIGSIDEAKSYLIDQYIENLLRKSFMDWIEEIDKVLKIKIGKNEIAKETIKLINETIQRRHLIIHNDGIINDLYLNKIDSTLRQNLKKGEELTSDYDYINSSISTFRTFGLILIYLYGLKKYRHNIDDFFMVFHVPLLSYLKEDPIAPRYIFKDLSEKVMLGKEIQSICKVNYFLTYKLNNDNSIDSEIELFDTDGLDERFILAKKILQNKEENIEGEIIQFLNSLDNGDFLNAIDWPLFKLVKKSENYKEYINQRIEYVISEEMEAGTIEN